MAEYPNLEIINQSREDILLDHISILYSDKFKDDNDWLI